MQTGTQTPPKDSLSPLTACDSHSADPSNAPSRLGQPRHPRVAFSRPKQASRNSSAPPPRTDKPRAASPRARSPRARSPRAPSPRPASPPGYLRGRNPYGKILDKVEHPYREPRVSVVPATYAPSASASASANSSQAESKRSGRGSESPVTSASESPSFQPQQGSARAVRELYEHKAQEERTPAVETTHLSPTLGARWRPEATFRSRSPSARDTDPYLKAAGSPGEHSRVDFAKRQLHLLPEDAGPQKQAAADRPERPLPSSTGAQPGQHHASSGSHDRPHMQADDGEKSSSYWERVSAGHLYEMDGASSPLPTAFDNQGWTLEWFEQFPMDLSYDGSAAELSSSYSEHSSPLDFVLQDGSIDDRIPEDIDVREGYGRRATQDFGFPGARIKTVGATARNSIKTLEESGTRPTASIAVPRPSDRRSEVKSILKPATPANQRRAQNRAMTDCSAAGPYCYFQDGPSPLTNGAERGRSESISAAVACRTEEETARDMRRLLVDMLEDHAQTLKDMITNIKCRQPSLKELQSISSDLASSSRTPSKRKHSRHHHHHHRHPCSCCPGGQAYEHVRHSIYRPIGGHTRSCSHSRSRAQSRRSQSRQSIDEEFLSALCSYAQPKAAEKLNVGEPGQLDVNLNDRKSTLRDSTKSLPELIRLVNSAADDLGIDLDEKPSKADDEKFKAAPVEPEFVTPGEVPAREGEGGFMRRDGDLKSLYREQGGGADVQQPGEPRISFARPPSRQPTTIQQQALPLTPLTPSTMATEVGPDFLDTRKAAVTTRPDSSPEPPTSGAMPLPDEPVKQSAEEPVRQPPTPALEDEALLRSISRVSTITIPAPIISEDTGAELSASMPSNRRATRTSFSEDVDDAPLEMEMYDPPETPPLGTGLQLQFDTASPAPIMTALEEKPLAEATLWPRFQSLVPVSRTVTVTEVKQASTNTESPEPALELPRTRLQSFIPGSVSRAVTEAVAEITGTSAEAQRANATIQESTSDAVPERRSTIAPVSRAVTEAAPVFSSFAAEGRGEQTTAHEKPQETPMEQDAVRKGSILAMPLPSGDTTGLEFSRRKSTLRPPVEDVPSAGAVISRTTTLEPGAVFEIPQAALQQTTQVTPGENPAQQKQEESPRRAFIMPVSFGDTTGLEFSRKKSSIRPPVGEDISSPGVASSAVPAAMVSGAATRVDEDTPQEMFRPISRLPSRLTTSPTIGHEPLTVQRMPSLSAAVREDSMESTASSLQPPPEIAERKLTVQQTVEDFPIVPAPFSSMAATTAVPVEQNTQKRMSTALFRATTERDHEVLQQMPMLSKREDSMVSPLEVPEKQLSSQQQVEDGSLIQSAVPAPTVVSRATTNMQPMEQDVPKRVSMVPSRVTTGLETLRTQAMPSISSGPKNDTVPAAEPPDQQLRNQELVERIPSSETELPRALTVVEQDALRRASRLLSKVATPWNTNIVERTPTMPTANKPEDPAPRPTPMEQEETSAVGLDALSTPVVSVGKSGERPTEEKFPPAFGQLGVQQEQTAILDLDSSTVPLSQQPTRRRTETEEAAVLDRHAQQLVAHMSTSALPEQHGSASGTQEPALHSPPLRSPSLYFDIGPSLLRKLPRPPTLPSPDVPVRPIRRTDKRQSTRKEREHSTVTERSPAPLPVTYPTGAASALEPLFSSPTESEGLDESSCISQSSVSLASENSSTTSTSESGTGEEEEINEENVEGEEGEPSQWKWQLRTSSTVSTSSSPYSTSSSSSERTIAHWSSQHISSSSPTSLSSSSEDTIDGESTSSSTYSDHAYDPVIRRTTTIEFASSGPSSGPPSGPSRASLSSLAARIRKTSAVAPQTFLFPILPDQKPKPSQLHPEQQHRKSTNRWFAPCILSAAKPSTWTRPSRWHLEGVYDGLGSLGSWGSVQCHRGGDGYLSSVSGAESESTVASMVEAKTKMRARTASESEATVDAASVIVHNGALATEHGYRGSHYDGKHSYPSERSSYTTASASTSTTDLVSVGVVDILSSRFLHPHLVHSFSTPELRERDSTGAVAKLPPLPLRTLPPISSLPMPPLPLRTQPSVATSAAETITLGSSTSKGFEGERKGRGKKVEGKLRVKRLWVSLGLACYLLE